MAQQLSGADLQGWDGWIALPACTFVSSTSFTTAIDLSSVLEKGDKIWFGSNGIAGSKWFFVTGVSGTTVSVTGGSDYTPTNNTILAPAYSKMASPFGFPQWFNYTVTWTGFSAAPTGGGARFTVLGRTVIVDIFPTTAGTSNATTTTATLPITAANTIASTSYRGLVAGEDNTVFLATPSLVDIPVGSSTASFYKDSAATGWTASGSKLVRGQFSYEF